MIKDIIDKIKNGLNYVLKIIFSMASFVALTYVLYWGGLKGFTMLLLGMFIMAYLMLSKNIMVQAMISYFEADGFIGEIKDEKKDTKS